MARLLLVRHGETEYNTSLRYMGQRDVPLSGRGQQQTEQLRHRLSGEEIGAAYTSDLKRAAATAGHICEGRAIKVQACRELREIDVGDCEGLTFQEIAERYPHLTPETGRPGRHLQFPQGEPLDGLAKRTAAFLDGLKMQAPGEAVLVVSHGGPIRVMLCHLLGLRLDHWWQFRLDTGSVTIVETYPEGAILNLLNDTSHLESAASREGTRRDDE